MPCVNGPYYREHIPAILREVASTYHPEGFTDNSWSGLSRANICLCDNCRAKFRKDRGLDLPQRADWNDSGLPGMDRVELRVLAWRSGISSTGPRVMPAGRRVCGSA